MLPRLLERFPSTCLTWRLIWCPSAATRSMDPKVSWQSKLMIETIVTWRKCQYLQMLCYVFKCYNQGGAEQCGSFCWLGAQVQVLVVLHTWWLLTICVYIQVWVPCLCVAGPGCVWSLCRMVADRRGGCVLALSPPHWLWGWELPAASPNRRWR